MGARQAELECSAHKKACSRAAAEAFG
jgi:hypothetical protein